MKFNTKGIRFNTWLYFLSFSVLILGLLGFLLIVLIKPYYRNSQIATIDTITSAIEENLIYKSPTDKDIDDTSKLVIGNEQLHIIPGFNKDNNINDMPGNVIILKAGKNIREIKESLLGINRNVYFVENCGMDNELIKKGAENIPDTAGYYSMVIIESE